VRLGEGKMQNTIVTLGILVGLMTSGWALAGSVGSDCRFNGIELKGKVQVVSSYADIKVQEVSSYGDLKVQEVSSYPDSCGEWQFVDSYPDFKIQYVSSYGDIKIQKVSSYPGVN
jgi:hypothetical protein